MCGATMIWLANPSLKESKSLAGFKGKSCEMSPLDCVQEICINLRVLRCGNNDDECQEKECSPSLKEDIISVIAKDELQEQVSNQNLLLSNCNQTVFKHWRTFLTKKLLCTVETIQLLFGFMGKK